MEVEVEVEMEVEVEVRVEVEVEVFFSILYCFEWRTSGGSEWCCGLRWPAAAAGVSNARCVWPRTSPVDFALSRVIGDGELALDLGEGSAASRRDAARWDHGRRGGDVEVWIEGGNADGLNLTEERRCGGRCA